MAGKQGKSGGARKGAGRLIRSNRDAPFDTERARALKVLVISRGWPYDAAHVRHMLDELIDVAWEDYERPILREAEAEGLII
jgi:CO dehydrogenase/acetyl-CoA synthase alpha subunit